MKRLSLRGIEFRFSNHGLQLSGCSERERERVPLSGRGQLSEKAPLSKKTLLQESRRSTDKFAEPLLSFSSPQSKNQLPIHILASRNTQTAFTGVQLVLKSGPKDLVLMKDGVRCSQ